MMESLRMLDVPKDIPEELALKKPAKVKPGEFASDLAIADLGEPSIMDDDPTVRQLLADQLRPPKETDEIPAAKCSPAPCGPTNPSGAGDLVAGESNKPTQIQGPMVPDFRGKSLRDVVEESSASGIDVMIEGSGVARAQVPLPGSPLHLGEQIRIVFTR
jgi:hypothetical protein